MPDHRLPPTGTANEPAHVDLLPENVDDAFELLASAREQHPWAATPMGPELLRHAEVEALLVSPELDQTGMSLMEFNGVTEGLLHDWWSMIMFASEGEQHRRLRSAVRGWLTPRRLSELEDPIRDACEGLMAGLPRGTRVDLAQTLAAEVPLTAVCLLLGVDVDGVAVLGSAATDVGMAFGVFDKDERRQIEAALEVLLEWAERTLAEARPGTLAASIAESADGGALSRQESEALVANIVFAAQDTTRFLIANTLWLLGRNPSVLTDLRHGRTPASAVVEESLRFLPRRGARCGWRPGPPESGRSSSQPATWLWAHFGQPDAIQGSTPTPTPSVRGEAKVSPSASDTAPTIASAPRSPGWKPPPWSTRLPAGAGTS